MGCARQNILINRGPTLQIAGGFQVPDTFRGVLAVTLYTQTSVFLTDMYAGVVFNSIFIVH